jgi:hypothetical protein
MSNFVSDFSITDFLSFYELNMSVARVAASWGLSIQQINLINLFNPSLMADLAAGGYNEEMRQRLKVLNYG